MLSWSEYNKKNNEDLFGYALMGRKDRKKSYEDYVKREQMNSAPTATTLSNTFPSGWTVYDINYTMPCSLGTCEAAPPKKFSFGGNQKEGNNPMNYATATVQAGTTETQDQRKYLSGRLTDVYYSKLRPLEAQFGLIDDERPTTPKELKERIAAGKFIIKGIKDAEAEDFDDDDDQYFYGSWYSMIRWRDPARKADADGYQAAVKELQELQQKTLDIIKIKDPEAGLKAVEDLEAWKPTGAAN